MSERVKKRTYSSAVREEQAAQTRARVVDAAARLFLRDGYARTTIKAIAADAGVAVDTVYATFGTKARVLTAVVDRALVPQGDVPNVMERPEALAVRDEPDQRRQLHLYAQDMVTVMGRVGPIFEIMRTASAVEPQMAAVFAEMNGYRLRNMRQVAEWVAARGPLRVPVDRAAETIWAIASPDVTRMLREGRGWSEAEHAAWLEDTLVRLLLPDPPAATSRRRR
jgi:AcrR family transcriptional regulator